MKFGTALDSIYTTSFRVELGGDVTFEKENRILHTFVDKSTELVDYGSRKQVLAKINIVDIEKSDFVELIDYLDANQGQNVYVTEEGESIFTGYNPYTTYGVCILKYSDLSEVDFSQTRSRFRVSVELAYVGEFITDKINPDNTSLIDFLVRVDTVRANFVQSSTPTATAIGQRWYSTHASTTRKLYEWDGTAWKFLYTVAPDDSTYNFIKGVFYWSLFSTVPQNLPDIEQSYVAGFINRNSLSLPAKSINLFNGPAIAYKTGFEFSLRNNLKFWEYIISNKIPVFGATVDVYLANTDSPTVYVQKVASGVNDNNEFGFTDYQFKVEPKVLNKEPEFPNTYIKSTNSRYTNTNSEYLDKPEIVTYGEFDLGLLQNVSSEQSSVIFKKGLKPNGDWVYKSDFVNGVLVESTPSSGIYDNIECEVEYWPAIDDYIPLINANPEYYCVLCFEDTNTASTNAKKTRNIVSISRLDGIITIVISEPFPTAPTFGAKVSIKIIQKQYAFQINADANNSGGFFIGDTEGVLLKTISKDGKQLEEVPSISFNVNDEKNLISMNVADYVYNDSLLKFKSSKDFEGNLIGAGLPRRGADLTYNSVTWVPQSYYDFNTYIYFTPEVRSGTKILRHGFDGRFDVDFKYEDESDTWCIVKTYPINHAFDEILRGKEEYRMCFDMNINSGFSIYDFSGGGVSVFQNRPLPFNFEIRFKKTNGTYFEDASWKKEFEYKMVTYWNREENIGIDINNFPDGNAISGNFGGDTREPTEVFDYIVSGVFTDNTTALANTPMNGLYILNSSGISLLKKKTSATTFFDMPTPSQGDLAWNLGNDNIYMYDFSGSDFNLVGPITRNYIKGRDLFDISSLFDTFTDWQSVVSMEIIISAQNFRESEILKDSTGATIALANFTFHKIQYTENQLPQIYFADEYELGDKPMFSKVKGRVLDGDFGDPKEIIKDIMDSTYGPTLWDETSLDAIRRLELIKWRKQFTEVKKSNDFLNEILMACWACCIYDNNDKIVFKSLNLADHSLGSPSKVFNESNIIDGSFSAVKMRDSTEIYQKFMIGYDYNPVSSAIPSVNKYAKSIKIEKGDSDIDDKEMEKYLEWSNTIYSNNNIYKKDIEYIYREEDVKKILPLMARWFLFNSWEIGFKVSISNILNEDTLNYMDYVQVNSSFFTNGEGFDGFISSIRPNIYNGTIDLKIYIPYAPGSFGPYKDPFNDALQVLQRDLTGWSDANGRINDAGRVSTRTIGSYEQKDAGRVSTRDFNEW